MASPESEFYCPNRTHCNQLARDFVAVQEELERLRAALNEIATFEVDEGASPDGYAYASVAHDMARAALNTGEAE